jgi:hypothetical protein
MLRTLLLIFLALLPAACTGIPRGWQEAKRSAVTDVNGAWLGTWRSDVNGHSGGLRAVVTPVPGTSETRLFRFRASWAKILCAGFSFEGTVKAGGPNTWTVTGSKDLGRVFGGTFTCTGTVRADEFKARYDSKMDRGVMELRRVRNGP